MPTQHEPKPKNAGKAAIVIVAIVAAIIVVIFVGRNIFHAKENTQQNESTMTDPSAKPQGPHDLQSEPANKRQ